MIMFYLFCCYHHHLPIVYCVVDFQEWEKKQKWNLIGILDGVGIVDKGGNNGIFHQGNIVGKKLYKGWALNLSWFFCTQPIKQQSAALH